MDTHQQDETTLPIETEAAPEAPLSAQTIAAALEKDFLGLKNRDNEHWPEWEFTQLQDFFYTAEDETGAKRTEQYSNEQMIQKITATEYWNHVVELRNITLNEKQVDDVLSLNDALAAHPETVAMMLEGIYAFQEARMRDLHVPDASIQIGITHERQVQQLISNPGDGGRAEPLAILAASYHDWIKYSGDKQRDGTYKTKQFLGLHESASAIGSMELTTQLFEFPGIQEQLMQTLQLPNDETGKARYAEMVAATAQFTAVAIANHGEGEFPQFMAVRNPRTARPVSEKLGLYRLFADLYINNYREMGSVLPGVPQEKVAALKRISEGLNAADMLNGTYISSFKKFHDTVQIGRFTEFSSSKDYIYSFYPNFTNDYSHAPDAMGLRRSSSMEDERARAEFLFAAVKAIDMGGEQGAAFTGYAEELLGDEFKEDRSDDPESIAGMIRKMKEVFAKVRLGGPSVEGLETHKALFAKLVDKLYATDIAKLHDSQLHELNQQVLAA